MSDHPFTRRPRSRLAAAIALGIAWLPAFAAEPQATSAQTATASDAQTIEALTRRLEALERSNGVGTYASGEAPSLADLQQRLTLLERKLELQEEAAAAAAEKTPTATLDAKGLTVKSPGTSGFEVKLRGLVQGDGRFYVGDEKNPQNDGFLLRRVEPTLEGSFGPLVGFRLQAQLAGGEGAGESASLNDAYLDFRFDPRATVRVGKFKQPFGLEQLQPSGSLATIERGLPTELTPVRDLGVQLQGELASSTLNYAIGVFNGGVDGRDASTRNPDNDFEATARVFWEPFKNDASALSGLGFGIAASVADVFGSITTTATTTQLPRYRTPGQVQFFGYRAETASATKPDPIVVLADGLHRRWSPQAYYYNGPLGLQAEYVTSEQEVRVTGGANAGRVAHLENNAWQLTAGWVLTGEDAGYRGVAKPNHPFTLDEAGWGAFEVVGRVGELDIDDDAFPLFADPAKSASRVRAWSLGLNWYLTQNLKLATTWSQARFDGGAADGANREDEKTLFTRAQLNF